MLLQERPSVNIMSLNTVTDSILAMVNVDLDIRKCCSTNPSCQMQGLPSKKPCKFCKLTYHSGCIKTIEENETCGCHLVRPYKARY